MTGKCFEEETVSLLSVSMANSARSQLIHQPLGRIPPCTCPASQTLPEASKAQRDWHLVSLVQAGLIKQSIKYLSAL